MDIAIVGAGNFGSAFARLARHAGHTVTVSESTAGEQRLRDVAAETGASPAPTARAVAAARLTVLAVPFGAVEAVCTPEVVAAAAGKIVVDVTNPLGPDRRSLAIGHTTSAAEQIAHRLPGSHVVKAFSTLLARNLTTTAPGGSRLLVPVAGDDADAKSAVLALALELGFDAVDVGPLVSARYLEPVIVLLLQLAQDADRAAGRSVEIGLALARS